MVQTYHATCEMVAKSKRQAMNNSISGVEKHGCAMATEGGAAAEGAGRRGCREGWAARLQRGLGGAAAERAARFGPGQRTETFP